MPLATGSRRAATFASLQDPTYRTLWWGGLVSFLAVQMEFISRGWLAYELTGSNSGLGAVFLGFGVPMLILTPWGGVVADRLPKRKVLIACQLTLGLSSAGIFLAVALDVIAYWMLIAGAVLQGAGFSFLGPARMAFTGDLVGPERLAQHLTSIAKLGEDTGVDWREIVPVSAVADDQVDLLEDLLVAQLPTGPRLYPDGELTDEPEETLVAELIREAALEGVRDELPHSIAVVIEEMVPRADRPEDRPLLDVHAQLFVERESQKGIIIGHKGSRLKEIGTTSRVQIEKLLGTPVHLDLRVKVAKDWQRDPRQLRRLGF